MDKGIGVGGDLSPSASSRRYKTPPVLTVPPNRSNETTTEERGRSIHPDAPVYRSATPAMTQEQLRSLLSQDGDEAASPPAVSASSHMDDPFLPPDYDLSRHRPSTASSASSGTAYTAYTHQPSSRGQTESPVGRSAQLPSYPSVAGAPRASVIDDDYEDFAFLEAKRRTSSHSTSPRRSTRPEGGRGNLAYRVPSSHAGPRKQRAVGLGQHASTAVSSTTSSPPTHRRSHRSKIPGGPCNNAVHHALLLKWKENTKREETEDSDEDVEVLLASLPTPPSTFVWICRDLLWAPFFSGVLLGLGQAFAMYLFGLTKQTASAYYVGKKVSHAIGTGAATKSALQANVTPLFAAGVLPSLWLLARRMRK